MYGQLFHPPLKCQLQCSNSGYLQPRSLVKIERSFMFMKSQSLKVNYHPGDHINHVVGANGMLPVTPGEYDRHGEAIEQSGDQKPVQECSIVTQTKCDRTE